MSMVLLANHLAVNVIETQELTPNSLSLPAPADGLLVCGFNPGV